MRKQIALLFDEFATAYRRGEAPDVLAYLARAGDDADALAALLDRFLQAVPARQPTEEELVLMDARLMQEPPLLVLRRRRGLSRAAVVDAIVSTLALDRTKRDKVARYYHELETGLLDPAPVEASVWDVLSELLQANVRVLASAFRAPPLAAAPARRRAEGGLHLRAAAVPPPAERAERDEIDRLFTGAS